MNSILSRNGLLILCSIILLSVTIPVSTTASVPLYGPAVISAPGEYALQNDVINDPFTHPWNGIVINSPGIWLDGMGHTIDGGERTTSSSYDDVHGIYAHPVSGSPGMTLSNITVTNVTVTGCRAGIALVNVTASRVHHVTVRNNSYAGISLFYSSENQIFSIYATGNSGAGISIRYRSDRNGLANNTLSSNVRGIETVQARGNFIGGNYATGNTIGILLNGSSNNTVRDNTITGINGTGEGLFLQGSHGNNILSRNIVRDNSEGIRIDPPQADADLIYDNNFNNTVNAVFSSSATNIWNTTEKQGPNIMGGKKIGGNYWATPDGDGFSQTHHDIYGDGFASSMYGLAPNNTDYLPLAMTSPLPSILAPGALIIGLIAAAFTKGRTGKLP
jgi:parallel beta-helix repeat protein